MLLEIDRCWPRHYGLIAFLNGNGGKQSSPGFDSDPITGTIIGAAIEVHRMLGPGLLESAYRSCLCYELAELELKIDVEPFLPISYKTLNMPRAFRLDLIVEDAVIVELKSVEKILPVHEAQVLTYLKLTGLKRGVILNFNVVLMKNGIRRLNLSKPSSFSPSSPVNDYSRYVSLQPRRGS